MSLFLRARNVAKNCFAENLRLFAPAETQPEKFNLYKGLSELADTLTRIESDLADIKDRLRRIENAARR